MSVHAWLFSLWFFPKAAPACLAAGAEPLFRPLPFPPFYGWLLGFGLLVWVWLGWRHVTKARAHLEWPSVDGEITGPGTFDVMTAWGHYRGSRITTNILKGVHIPYKYTVAGREYSSERALLAEVGSPEQAVELLEKYPLGKRVRVHYNPESPQEAVLETPFYWSHYVHAAMPAAGLAALLVAFEVNLTWALALLAAAIWVFWSAVAWHDIEISFAAGGVRSPELRSQLKALPKTNWEFVGAFLLFFSFLFSAITLLIYFFTINLKQLWTTSGGVEFALLAGFVLAGLALLGLRWAYLSEQHRRLFGPGFLAGPAFAVAIFCAWGYAAANMHYDTGPAETVTGVVERKWKDERGNILYVRFLNRTLPVSIKVSPEDYERARKGTAVSMKIRPGYFNMPWVEGYELEAPPGPD